MNIIINRSDAIGDTILTIPMAALIKKNFPSAKIVFIVSKRTKDLFIDHPHIEDIWECDPSRSSSFKFWYLNKKFKQFKPDAYFHVGGSHVPSLVAFYRRVKVRGGLVSKWQTFLFLNKGVRQPRSMVVMHETEYNLNLLKPLGIEYNPDDRNEIFKNVVNLSDSEDAKLIKSFKEDLNNEGLNSSLPYIVIHPGMTGHTLNWSSRNYGRFITRFEEEYSGLYNYIISYTPSDGPYLVGLKDHLASTTFDFLKNRIYFLDGTKKGLRFSMSILKNSTLYLGASTGPTHLANVLETKLIGIYSPIKVQSSKRWGPLMRNERTEVIVPDVVCGESKSCVLDECPYYECMAKIEVGEVLLKSKDLLSK